jgi:hypothetical protein
MAGVQIGDSYCAKETVDSARQLVHAESFCYQAVRLFDLLRPNCSSNLWIRPLYSSRNQKASIWVFASEGPFGDLTTRCNQIYLFPEEISQLLQMLIRLIGISRGRLGVDAIRLPSVFF